MTLGVHQVSTKELLKNVLGVIELIFYLDSLRIDFDEINLFCCKIDRSPQIFFLTQLNEWLHDISIHMLCGPLKPTILMKCLF